MKRIFISALLLLVPLGLLAPMILSLRAQTAPAGDDLSTALVNHGMDPGTAVIAAAGIEAAVANNNAFLGRIAADEKNIATLQAQVLALQSGGSSAPTSIQVKTSSTTVSSGPIQTAATSDIGGGLKLILAAGQTYDYTVPSLAAGTYQLVARLDSDASSTGATAVHFEIPPGTNVTGPMSQAAGTQWANVTAGQMIALPAGPMTVRLVTDSAVAGGHSYANWFELLKQ